MLWACLSFSFTETAIFCPKLHGEGLFHQTKWTKTPFTEFIFVVASLQIGKCFWLGYCLYLLLHFTDLSVCVSTHTRPIRDRVRQKKKCVCVCWHLPDSPGLTLKINLRWLWIFFNHLAKCSLTAGSCR